MKATLLKWLIPSNWIDWLKGRKRILGAIALILWVVIYALPSLCTVPVCSTITQAGAWVQSFLLSCGLDLDDTLLTTGGALTVIGLVDWVIDHFITRFISGTLKKIEGGVAKVLD